MKKKSLSDFLLNKETNANRENSLITCLYASNFAHSHQLIQTHECVTFEGIDYVMYLKVLILIEKLQQIFSVTFLFEESETKYTRDIFSQKEDRFLALNSIRVVKLTYSPLSKKKNNIPRSRRRLPTNGRRGKVTYRGHFAINNTDENDLVGGVKILLLFFIYFFIHLYIYLSLPTFLSGFRIRSDNDRIRIQRNLKGWIRIQAKTPDLTDSVFENLFYCVSPGGGNCFSVSAFKI